MASQNPHQHHMYRRGKDDPHPLTCLLCNRSIGHTVYYCEMGHSILVCVRCRNIMYRQGALCPLCKYPMTMQQNETLNQNLGKF